VKPDLIDLLVALSKTKYNGNKNNTYDYEIGFDVTESNLETYLADIENFVNILVEYKSSID